MQNYMTSIIKSSKVVCIYCFRAISFQHLLTNINDIGKARCFSLKYANPCQLF